MLLGPSASRNDALRTQLPLDFTPRLERPVDFDGGTYVSRFDRQRLGAQLRAVKALMLDGEWRSLAQIRTATGYPESSVSARLRDLRKIRFGGYAVERRRVGEPKSGMFEYRVRET